MVNLDYYGNSSYTSFHPRILYYNQVAIFPFRQESALTQPPVAVRQEATAP